MKDNSYQITLPKGEALRPFFELNQKERHEVGLKIFQHVTELAAQVGALPVTAKTLCKKTPNGDQKTF